MFLYKSNDFVGSNAGFLVRIRERPSNFRQTLGRGHASVCFLCPVETGSDGRFYSPAFGPYSPAAGLYGLNTWTVRFTGWTIEFVPMSGRLSTARRIEAF